MSMPLKITKKFLMYEFMKTQHYDLILAEENLKKIIEELDQGMPRQFEEKFQEIVMNLTRYSGNCLEAVMVYWNFWRRRYPGSSN